MMSACLFASLVAYVGPGAGLGLLGALLAVGGAVFAALFFVVLWPVRMLLRRVKEGRSTESTIGDRRPAA